MTDTTKYANISLSLETYNKIKEQSNKLCGVKLSYAQTVTHAVNLVDECMKTGLIPTAFHELEPSAKKFRFAGILSKFKLIINNEVPFKELTSKDRRHDDTNTQNNS
jgi:hypothetical protein